ncbi:hypothetical protein [Streptomyces sp. NPDC002156]
MSKVFISRSAHSDTCTAQVHRLVARELRDRGYEIANEEGRIAGQVWHPRLYEQLLECNAAIVLIDRAALTSGWVHREADILLWRHHFNHTFFVLSAPSGGVTPHDMRAAGYEDLLALPSARTGPLDRQPADPEDAAQGILRFFPPLTAQLDDSAPTLDWGQDEQTRTRPFAVRRRSVTLSVTRLLFTFALLLAGRRGHSMRTAWLADLMGSPEEGITVSWRDRVPYTLGLVVAAARMRLHDMACSLWRPVDWLLSSDDRISASIAAWVGGLAIYIMWHDGLHMLLTEGWGWCGACGGALYLLTRWLRRVRGIELSAARADPPEE